MAVSAAGAGAGAAATEAAAAAVAAVVEAVVVADVVEIVVKLAIGVEEVETGEAVSQVENKRSKKSCLSGDEQDTDCKHPEQTQ